MGRAWQSLSAEGKQWWEAESEKDQKRYHAECAEAGLQPKHFPHIAGQVRPAGLVDPKKRPPAPKKKQPRANGGAFALVRLTLQAGSARAAQIEQPPDRTTARTVGKKWNAATRSFV